MRQRHSAIVSQIVLHAALLLGALATLPSCEGGGDNAASGEGKKKRNRKAALDAGSLAREHDGGGSESRDDSSNGDAVPNDDDTSVGDGVLGDDVADDDVAERRGDDDAVPDDTVADDVGDDDVGDDDVGEDGAANDDAETVSAILPLAGLWVGGAIPAPFLDDALVFEVSERGETSGIRAAHEMCPSRGHVAEATVFTAGQCSPRDGGFQCVSGPNQLTVEFGSERCATAEYRYSASSSACGTVAGVDMSEICWVEEPCQLVDGLTVSAENPSPASEAETALSVVLEPRYPEFCSGGVDNLTVDFSLPDDVTASSLSETQVVARNGSAQTQLTAGVPGVARVQAQVTDATGFVFSDDLSITVGRHPCDPYAPVWSGSDRVYAGEPADLQVRVRDEAIDCPLEPTVMFRLNDYQDTGSRLVEESVVAAGGLASLQVLAGPSSGRAQLVATVEDSQGNVLDESFELVVLRHPCELNRATVSVEPSSILYGEEALATVEVTRFDEEACLEPFPPLLGTVVLSDPDGTGSTAPASVDLVDGVGTVPVSAGFGASGGVELAITVEGPREERLSDTVDLGVSRSPCDHRIVDVVAREETRLETTVEVELQSYLVNPSRCEEPASDLEISVALVDPDGTNCKVASPTVTLVDQAATAVIQDCEKSGVVTVEVSFVDIEGHLQVDTAELDVLPYLAEVADAGVSHLTSSGDYLYGTGFDQFTVIDISSRTAPTVVGRLPIEATMRGPVAAGHFVYIPAIDDGMYVVDVSDPAAPTLAAHYESPAELDQLVIRGNYAYIVSGDNGVLLVLDISDPSLPALVGSMTFERYPWGGRIALVNDALVIRLDREVATVDLSDPIAPIMVSTLAATPRSRLYGFGGLLIGGGESSDSSVAVIDPLASPPVLFGELDVFGGVSDITSAGDSLYVSYRYELGRLDVSDPASPVFAATLSHDVYGPDIAATPDGYVYLAGSTLRVVRF